MQLDLPAPALISSQEIPVKIPTTITWSVGLVSESRDCEHDSVEPVVLHDPGGCICVGNIVIKSDENRAWRQAYRLSTKTLRVLKYRDRLVTLAFEKFHLGIKVTSIEGIVRVGIELMIAQYWDIHHGCVDDGLLFFSSKRSCWHD